MRSLQDLPRRLGVTLGLVLATGIASGCLANVTLTPAGERPVALTLLDANADGRTDVAVVDAATHTMKLFLQDEGGSLGVPLTLQPPPGSVPQSLAGGLPAAAGTPALAVADPQGNRVDLYTGAVDGETASGALDLGPGAAPTAVATARIDADGYADLLVGTASPVAGD